MVKEATLAVIPARGGSKRIPRKNIVDFHGKPMIAWTIAAALESGVFDQVVVSTDDEEIASISQEYGARVPFMRSRHADDHSPVSEVVMDALHQTGRERGRVAMLMPNCPLRSSDDIRTLHQSFISRSADFQISAFAYGHANPWWAHRVEDKVEGRVSPVFDTLGQRSQDLPELLCPTGACWWAEVSALLQAGTFYGPDYRFAPISWYAAMDIDVAEDLELARALFTVRRRKDEESL